MRDALALALATMMGIAPVSVPDGSCVVEDVSITWGFKESFRSYISGSIANGSWEVSGDVGYEIPAFTFTGGRGYVSPDRTEGALSFEGELLFQGHGGILETSLQNPTVVFTGAHLATLVLDVTGDTMEEVSVSQQDVPFASITWDRASEEVSSEEGVWHVESAEVMLTDEGSAAFGTYPAGDVMDPMSMRIQVEQGCLSERGLWWIPGSALALAVLAGAIIAAIRRGRTPRERGRP